MLPNASKCFQVLTSTFKCFQVLLSTFKCFLVLSSASKCFQVFPSTSKCFHVLPSDFYYFLKLHNASLCFLVPPSASQCFPVLPSVSQCLPLLPSASQCSLAWNCLNIKSSYNKVLQTSLLWSLALPPAKAGTGHQYMYMQIMWEPLIIQESVSGHSWTSKVFNTMNTLDTYQFVWYSRVYLLAKERKQK